MCRCLRCISKTSIQDKSRKQAMCHVATITSGTRQRGHLPRAFLACMPLVITACSIGPTYHQPTVHVPSTYKELPPASFKTSTEWKAAQPNDGAPRGKWWEVFQEAQLNILEEQVNVSNQNIAAAEAQLRGARAAIRVARAGLFPTVTGTVATSGSHQSSNRPSSSSGTSADYQLPLDVSY